MRVSHWNERLSTFTSSTLKPLKSRWYSSSGTQGSPTPPGWQAAMRPVKAIAETKLRMRKVRFITPVTTNKPVLRRERCRRKQRPAEAVRPGVRYSTARNSVNRESMAFRLRARRPRGSQGKFERPCPKQCSLGSFNHGSSERTFEHIVSAAECHRPCYSSFPPAHRSMVPRDSVTRSPSHGPVA